MRGAEADLQAVQSGGTHEEVLTTRSELAKAQTERDEARRNRRHTPLPFAEEASLTPEPGSARPEFPARLAITDAQVHVWADPTPERPWPADGIGQAHIPRPFSYYELLARMDEAGVDRVVIVPPSWEGYRNEYAMEAAKNKVLPIGGGLYIPVVRPDQKVSVPYTEWTFSGDITRMPEFAAPALGNKANVVTIDAEIPEQASGCLYKLGSFAGGLTCYVKDGVLSYEYNLFEIQRTPIKAKEKLKPGKAKIEIETKLAGKKPGGPLDITMKVNGKEVAKGQVPVTASLMFTANDCLDIGIALGSPVSVDYHDDAPFKFNGKINEVKVKYVK